ncbi:MAG: peptidylprolyl isomerase [Cytophagales bacterium]|nr:peptidylprolyl isomerase [Bernardetiaceae bacterium]MDW8204748.1 peptidylprolyl isomerase [Cytophagales bacterium]
MKIERHTVATITYELRMSDHTEDQVLVEIVTEEDPMLFLVGESGLPEKFEELLMGKQPGDTFAFSISPEDGYGEYDPEAKELFPLEAFRIDGKIDEDLLQIGTILPLTNDEGDMISARVEQVTDSGVLLDFNHPLAGKTMHFTGKVIHVRQATRAEIEHGHVHGPGGVIH